MNNLFYYLFKLIHLIFTLFIIVTPFTNSNYFLLLHLVFVPFLLVHWIFNDNTCAITTVERIVKKRMLGDKYIDDEDCFTCQIIEPVFDLRKNYFEEYEKFLYFISTTLWLITIYKIYKKKTSGEIKSWYDMFKV